VGRIVMAGIQGLAEQAATGQVLFGEQVVAAVMGHEAWNLLGAVGHAGQQADQRLDPGMGAAAEAGHHGQQSAHEALG
jgi:hypothetical protein